MSFMPERMKLQSKKKKKKKSGKGQKSLLSQCCGSGYDLVARQTETSLMDQES